VEARISPGQNPINHHRGKMRARGSQEAMEKFRGKAAMKPTHGPHLQCRPRPGTEGRPDPRSETDQNPPSRQFTRRGPGP